MVCVGLPASGTIPLDPCRMVTEGYKILGSAVGNRRDCAEALALVALGKVKVELEVRPMSAIKEIYQELEKGAIKGRVVIDMRE
jgi:propanol-preferring alcohol dehydrogenase